MPFKKNDPQTIQWAKSGARKPFELEQKDKKRLIALLKRYFTLGELIASGKATDNQKKAFECLSSLALKTLDKLQANKTDLKLDFDKPFMILK